MKVLVAVLFVVSAVCGGDNDDGQYHPDENDEGRYYQDDSGKYIPDYSGQYIVDNSGNYEADGTGIYSENNRGGYREDENDSKSKAHFELSFGGLPRNTLVADTVVKPIPSYANFGNTNVADRTSYAVNTGSGIGPAHSSLGNSFESHGFNADGGSTIFGNSVAATSHAKTTFRQTPVAGKFSGYKSNRYNKHGDDGRWKIIRQSDDIRPDGYQWQYETENGIRAEESGKLANEGSKDETLRAKGHYEYTGPDNLEYRVTYTADENGFVAQGTHFPTSPPIPEPILQSLKLKKPSKNFYHK